MLNEVIHVDENCVGVPSILTIQDQIIQENEILEIALDDGSGMIEDIRHYSEPGV